MTQPYRQIKDMPDFLTWDQRNLASLAKDLYTQNLELREANEQLRLDVRDVLNQIRNLHLSTCPDLRAKHLPAHRDGYSGQAGTLGGS